jgi:hypothetical protein
MTNLTFTNPNKMSVDKVRSCASSTIMTLQEKEEKKQELSSFKTLEIQM